MKKETFNTFDGGMVRDLNPITTPNNVLTDALNATLVTFNGNENILQNDMGNTEVGTAFLPAGYVPVGMKEHGGIIYVAAWNPESKKGQIGSFPSPKRIWESGDWNVNTSGATIVGVQFNTTDFYEENSDFIHTEIVKKELFTYSDSTSKDLHPGDRFCITLEKSMNTLLHNYVVEDKIDIQLAVVKEDGTIEIIDNAKDNWFFTEVEVTDEDIEATSGMTEQQKQELKKSHLPIKQKQIASLNISTRDCQVFKGSSSGRLLLIISIKTLDSFDLTRTYSLEGDSIVVKFKGIGTIDNNVITSEAGQLGLYKDSENANNSEITITQPQEGGSVEYSIYPRIDSGIIKRFKRSGVINFDKIKKSQDDFHEWRYFVADDYLKIGWAYEFYNLDASKQIDYIELAFYDYEKPSSYPNSPSQIIQLVKDSYSGNFEEIFRNESLTIQKGRIYIVEFRRKTTDGVTTVIADKMLYYSKLYNSYYNNLYADSSNIDSVEFQPINNLSAQLDFTSNLEYSKDGVTKVYVKNPASTEYQDVGGINGLTQGYYVTDVESINDGETDTSENAHEYITKLTNDYSASINLTPKLNFGVEGIIGQPKNLNTIVNNFGLKNVSSTSDNSWVSISSNAVFSNISDTNIATDTSSMTKTMSGNNLNINGIKFSQNRYVQGKSTDVQQNTYSIQELAPLYSPQLSTEKKRMVFSAFNRESPIVVAMQRDDSYYNCTIHGDDVILGPSTGAGDDDDALDTAVRRLNESFIPTVSIMTGIGGDYGSLWMKGASRRSGSYMGGWSCGKNEVDGGDNFMIAVWKFDNGYSRIVNLFSPRTWKAQSGIAWPRLDVMLKCLLSQVFILQQVTKNGKYITTNNKYYRYQEGESSINFSIGIPDGTDVSSLTSNIMYPYSPDSEYINTSLYDLCNVWRAKGAATNKLANLVNLVPKVDLNYTDSIDLQQTIDEDFGINDVLRYYLGGKLELTAGDSGNTPGDIYIVDQSQSSHNKTVCANSNSTQPLPNNDGTFEWTGMPILKRCLSTASNGETIYDWNGGTWIMKYPFKKMFITKGEFEGWTSIPENESNELLGRSSFAEGKSYIGQWVKHSDQQAPDLFYSVLSSNKSLYSV